MNAVRSENIVTRSLSQIGECGLFLLRMLSAVPRSLRHYRETVRQLWFVGAMSLIIIMVCGLFVGMVLGLQLYDVLSIFGGTSATGTVVAIAIYRELGPVVTALLFAGRAGTSITAEIGLMRATDQIAAMEMMAVDPIAYVAVPRFLAGVIAMPLLTCVFCALGIFGGHLVGVTWLGIDNGTFWSNMTATVELVKDVINGVLWKSIVFGTVVSLIAVFQGYTTPPTSEGVAYATTRTVVASSIAILALDFVLTAFLM
ncbi:phospholipid/cholesterol/gamma-HCH transport system permease protein [Dyella jiangningensis]|uniref:lipid asymmetry maintenance ABC transporter permease subunit MlaE n=1 Tax=Dyella sp. AtDHG13 TaxID=1938897 RepID=UPI000885D419|nr:lipid asymmetry maintenance ABC transporter permease subunit MlaE [Dyella sp. AtDHG13]PXV59625.1 phospholipid/cholesterol/gamma-HCH transport system permease protein [Dyella sp. AtDHG13]SDJ29483.1 phospholipid/cholesterol/gamma-HCH transport system permease protein [Dyella jiangningensis]